jgi:hypothetical protein
MKSHYLAPVLTIGLLLFGLDTFAWSQMRLAGRGTFDTQCRTPQQRSCAPVLRSCAPVLRSCAPVFGCDSKPGRDFLFRPKCSDLSECDSKPGRDFLFRPKCSVLSERGVCQPCHPRPLASLLAQIDRTLQRILPCPKWRCKPSCCGEPTCDDRSGGIPLRLAPPDAEQEFLRDENPFLDDPLEAPPVPAAEAGYWAGRPVVIRRVDGEPAAETNREETPQRFQPVNALPLKGPIPIPRSVLREKTATTDDSRKCGTCLASADQLR